nr:MAG TPA: zinc-ribbon protein [Caudoviricetes sp.]
MAYKYLDNAVKSIEYQLNSAYSHGYSDGKEDARIEYSKHGKIVKMEILNKDKFDAMPDYYKSWPVKAWCSCGKPLNRLDYTFCPYCGGLIARGDEENGR